jgi:DNA-binding MarR family transcriptional regulator
VNVSSSYLSDLDIKKTEINELILEVNKLKKRVNEKFCKEDESFDKFFNNLDSLLDSINEYLKEMNVLKQALDTATSTRLSEKQKGLLRWLLNNYNDKMVYTVLIKYLSKTLNIPKSTIRWNLKRLREAGLIVAGNYEKKGIPVDLTNIGKMMANIIEPTHLA